VPSSVDTTPSGIAAGSTSAVVVTAATADSGGRRTSGDMPVARDASSSQHEVVTFMHSAIGVHNDGVYTWISSVI
jgi:hypothetical protein